MERTENLDNSKIIPKNHELEKLFLKIDTDLDGFIYYKDIEEFLLSGEGISKLDPEENKLIHLLSKYTLNSGEPILKNEFLLIANVYLS